ncbi:ankyrin repeat domain-containing protein 40-like [Vespa mandarinia]|uniref:ankyrin repeat domain-containing protein 40-like n=1 Tax=Vespa mandarinia TaxID=7446 RepID=UPI00160A2227|nr:ankyrin repeat domain-containing protein 40-like [Vespa mandarinia]XP_035735052.1 ankyrin repeat domain-containing protein 40-like [Vespa mandarinia]XP_035735053.1 ankyrin repeat domain-containing protein 40-like [Vespa mandarinia]XP_046836168.1 ankyrin repeat domain-containing protein 40-like [Vespa crabro]XP_047366091.1 ankyrin repeat domain-containing protein 40-like [Vespa velutina]
MEQQILEDRLKEAVCIGDTDVVQELINLGVNVNTQRIGSGWTPLHWACKKGFLDVVSLLLKHGADKKIKSENGESVKSLCSNEEILQLLNSDIQCNTNGPMIHQFMPKYKKNVITNVDPMQHLGVNHTRYELKNNNHLQDELVIKVRIANAPDPDFVEVELPMNDLTYQTLIQICCEEFGLCPYQILKLRKLPNTKLRKDKDIKRLQHFQEIEIITDPANVYKHVQYSNSVPNNISSTPANGYQSISHKDQTILY